MLEDMRICICHLSVLYFYTKKKSWLKEEKRENSYTQILIYIRYAILRFKLNKSVIQLSYILVTWIYIFYNVLFYILVFFLQKAVIVNDMFLILKNVFVIL